MSVPAKSAPSGTSRGISRVCGGNTVDFEIPAELAAYLAELDAFIKRESGKYQHIVEQTGIKPE